LVVTELLSGQQPEPGTGVKVGVPGGGVDVYEGLGVGVGEEEGVAVKVGVGGTQEMEMLTLSKVALARLPGFPLDTANPTWGLAPMAVMVTALTRVQLDPSLDS
jgi:hypothetical protein